MNGTNGMISKRSTDLPPAGRSSSRGTVFFRRSGSGLTMIEIMVALVILCLAITPLMRLQGLAALQKNVSIHEINSTNLALQFIDNILTLERSAVAAVADAYRLGELTTDEVTGLELADFESLPPTIRSRLLFNEVPVATDLLFCLQQAKDADDRVINGAYNLYVRVRWEEVHSTHDVTLARFFYVREQ